MPEHQESTATADADDRAPEAVVLLSESGHPIGTAPKASVHTDNTPLHLAFSCHVVDDAGRVLVTRRALTKIAWPGVWTNSFCGHPAPGEEPRDAVLRRAERELGLRVADVEEVLPDFRYRAVDDGGVVENEVCPVFVARAVGEPAPSVDEVAAWEWVAPADLAAAVARTPWAFSPWLALQIPRLALYTAPAVSP